MATAAPSTKKKVWTDHELEALPKDGYKPELLDGEIIMSSGHANHGILCVRVSSLLFQFVEQFQLGEVYGSNVGPLATSLKS